MLNREKDAVEIDRVLLAPVTERHVDDRGHGKADAGVGDENVEPAVAPGDLGDDFDPALLAGDVLLQKDRLAAGLGDAAGELRASQLVDVGGNDDRAFAREELDDCFANARGAARHQRDLAFYLPCHVHSLFCCSSDLLDITLSENRFALFRVMRYLITDGPWSGSATSTTR